MKKYSSLLLTIVFMLGSCSGADDPAPVIKDELVDPQEGSDPPSNAISTTSGVFTSFAHGLTGTAVLYVDANGKRTLRFDNFNMMEGPDVYVLFSKTNNYSKANTIAVSMLKGMYSNTSLNFELDSSIHLSAHKFVLVYCVQYSSLFGFSELK